jgi:heptosyltransferase-2
MSEGAAVDRILVRCPNWLGDVVMSTPGLRALRRAHPRARIVAQLPSALHPLLEGNPACDEVWPLAPRGARWSLWSAEARRVAEARFDLGLVVPESISSALRMRRGRVGHVVGFARDPLRRRLLDQVVPAPVEWGRRRLVSRERFVATLVAAVGAATDDLRLELFVDASEVARLEAALERRGGSLARLEREPPVVVAPGAGFGPAKCWPAASYAALVDRLAARGHRVVLVGSAADRKVVTAVAEAARSRPLVLGDALDLGALKALVRRARLLVANDAGARHVAAALGVPSVVFFGPTSVAKTADNLDAVQVLETDHDCRPCYRRRCPIDHRCLRSIGVDRAAAAAERALETRPREAVG